MKTRLGRLQEDFAIAISLVLITLLPLGLRAAGVVMVSIPLSLAVGTVLLHSAGFTLNQLTIVGFVIALGLLVDDSIVVVENIARFLRRGMSRTDAALAADGPIRHVVHFKFKKEATPEQVKKITDEFTALKTKIAVVESLEWGTNSSPEGLDKGFTHCWLVSFKTAKDRDAYLVHPAHKAFVEFALPLIEEALVVDFVPQK